VRRSRPPLLILAACLLAVATPTAAVRLKKRGPQPQGAWGKVITIADRERLRDWRKAWLDGLTQARGEGFAAAVAKEGALLDPDAGIDDAAIPDGLYHCRMIKLGRKPGLGAAFKAMPVATCRIRAQRLKILDGIQRPVGQLWPYDVNKLIFLGATVVGDESASIPYGRDKERDTLGLLDRIGKQRWRLVLPRPAWEALADVIDITPAE
jgi:hypothetical protein